MEAAEARLPRSKLQAAQGFSLTYDNAPVSLHPSSAASASASSSSVSLLQHSQPPRLLPLLDELRKAHIGAKYVGRMFRWEWNRCTFPCTASCTYIQCYLKCCYLGNVAFQFKMFEFLEKMINSHIIKCCFIH